MFEKFMGAALVIGNLALLPAVTLLAIGAAWLAWPVIDLLTEVLA